MKRMILALLMVVVMAMPCFADCSGKILDIEHVMPSSGSQFRFITQYTCNAEVVDVHGKPCDNCKQGNRVGGDKNLVDAKLEAENAISVQAEALNGRYRGNAEKVRNIKIGIHAISKGINLDGKTDAQVYSELKSVLIAERDATMLFKHDNVTANIDALKSQTVGYEKAETKYQEVYMEKNIEVDTSEKVTVTNIVQ